MFGPDRELNKTEAMWVARAMAKVSACDGIDERESDLINEFLKDLGTTTTFSDLVQDDFDPQKAKKDLSPEVSVMVLRGCWMVAFADGQVSTQEKDLIASIASGLGVTNSDQIRDAVIDELMQSLSHVKNIDALVELSKRLSS